MSLQPFEDFLGDWIDRPVTLRSMFASGLTPNFWTQKQGSVTWPKMTHTVTETEHVYSFDVPGVKKSDLSVQVDSKDRSVTVSGTRHTEKEHEDDSYSSKEVFDGSFLRKVSLDNTVNLKDLKAAHMSHDNGVLTVSFKRTKPVTDEHVYNLTF